MAQGIRADGADGGVTTQFLLCDIGQQLSGRAGSGDERFTTPDFSSWENFEARVKAKAAGKVRRDEAKKWEAKKWEAKKFEAKKW